ncbi:MAG TPA: sugar phosphate nucleotidyltransferase [Gemmataceae bacterium]|nr:sugar phosphate nucleotidyltransferase [Gemmataceae bacterium]
MTTPEKLTALVLCGGAGTRLRSVIGSKPKVLATVGGRPFIDYQLALLRGLGIRDIVLATGMGADAVVRYCGQGVGYSLESEPLGTGGAIRNASGQFRSDPVLVLNGDSLVRFDLVRLIHKHLMHQARATMVLAEVPDRIRFGAVELGPDSAVIAFGEKGRTGPGFINAGAYLLGRDVIEAIPTAQAVSLENEVFPTLVGKGLYASPVRGPFLDIGTAESYATADDFVAAWGWPSESPCPD